MGLKNEDIEFMKLPSSLESQMKFSLAVNQRKILINENITENTAMEVLYYLSKIKSIDEQLGTKDDIEIYVDTNGGEVFAAFSVVDMIEQMKKEGYNIITINMSKAFSAGFLIVLSGSIRKAFSRSRYMLHDVSNATWGKTQQMREDIEETEIIRDMCFDLIQKYCNISEEQIKYWIDRKVDKFFSAKEMLELKGVDEIL